MKQTAMILIFSVFIGFGCKTLNLYQASSKGDVEKVREIVRQGSDINIDQKGDFGLTPLMVAAKQNNYHIIRTLIENGADVNAKDDFRKSALWYAYDYENFDAFKILLENGAKIDFPLSYDAAPTLYKKKKLYKLAKEYTLLRKIQESPDNINLFEAYFSEFSNGYYSSEVREIFETMIQKDYQAVKSASSVPELRRFVNKYANLGQRYYVVTADRLNIRAGNSTRTQKTGEYTRGDKIYAIAENGGWIQTERGWVSKTYISPETRSISLVSRYIRQVKARIESLTLAKPEKRPEISEKISEPETEPVSHIQESPPVTIQKELDNILKDATLSKLEVFIQKYKDNPECKEWVNKAKEAYKTILLKN